MKLKITKLIVAASAFLLVFAVNSCKKSEVKKVEVDNSFAFSIFNDDSITMADFLDIIDSTWRDSLFVVAEDGTLSVVASSDTTYNIITGREILDNIPTNIEINTSDSIQIPAIQIPDSLFIVRDLIQLSQQTGIPLEPFTYRCKIDTMVDLGEVASVSYHVDDNFVLKEVKMNDGSLNLQFEVEGIDQIITVTTELWTKEIKIAGSDSLLLVMSNPGQETKDLAGSLIIPNNEYMVFNAKTNIYMEEIVINEQSDLDEVDAILSKLQLISQGKKKITLYCAINDSKVEYVKATIDGYEDRFSDNLDGIDLDLPSISGDLWLHTPLIKLGYVNTFEFGVNAIMDTLDYTNNNDQNISLLANPIQMNLTKTEDFKTIDLSPNLVEAMEILGGVKKMYYSAGATITTDVPCTITPESHIDFATNIEMPFKMKTNQMSYTDSFPISLGEDLKDVTNFLDEIELKFKINNGLPLQMTMQLYTCDSTLMQTGEFVTDSIFKADEAGQMHNTIVSTFGEGVANSTIIVTVKDDGTIDNLLKANKLMMKLMLTTDGNMVTIKTTDLFGINIGLKTKTTEINLEGNN